MTETLERIEGTFTYTYDLFTVFFYGDHVFVGEKEYPIGQCCVDITNLDEAVLDEIKQRVSTLIPVACTLLIEKNRQRRNSRAGEAERCLGHHVCFAGLRRSWSHGRNVGN